MALDLSQMFSGCFLSGSFWPRKDIQRSHSQTYILSRCTLSPSSRPEGLLALLTETCFLSVASTEDLSALIFKYRKLCPAGKGVLSSDLIFPRAKTLGKARITMVFLFLTKNGLTIHDIFNFAGSLAPPICFTGILGWSHWDTPTH